MKSLTDLQKELRAIESEIELLKSNERAAAIVKIEELAKTYGIDLSSLQRRRTAARSAPSGGKKAQVKYRDVATGEEWSGRGMHPRWLRARLADGRDISEFLVVEA